MEKKATYQRVVDYSADLMDKHFPKGECKERGEALVFNAELITYVMEELGRAREEGFKKGRDKIDKSTPEQKEEWEKKLDGLIYGITVSSTTTLEEGWKLKDPKKLKKELDKLNKK